MPPADIPKHTFVPKHALPPTWVLVISWKLRHTAWQQLLQKLHIRIVLLPGQLK